MVSTKGLGNWNPPQGKVEANLDVKQKTGFLQSFLNSMGSGAGLCVGICLGIIIIIVVLALLGGFFAGIHPTPTPLGR